MSQVLTLGPPGSSLALLLLFLCFLFLRSEKKKTKSQAGAWRSQETLSQGMLCLLLFAGDETQRFAPEFEARVWSPWPETVQRGDQKRIATPERAMQDGADWLVVGRPIRDAPDRRAAAEAITRAARSVSRSAS